MNGLDLRGTFLLLREKSFGVVEMADSLTSCCEGKSFSLGEVSLVLQTTIQHYLEITPLK